MTEVRVISHYSGIINVIQMRAVTEFKYLGRVLTNTDDDWPLSVRMADLNSEI